MAGKMDQRTIIVLAVVGSLGVLSAILGFSGELIHSCETGVGLGVCATIFMIIAQVIIAVVGGCCGCYKSRAIPSETSQIIVVVCAVASWIATLIAFALLVMGANLSAWCHSDGAPNGIFAGGALLALAATALGLSSYILLRRQPGATATARKTEGGDRLPAGGAGIAMGQPQFPQQSPPQGYGQTPPPNYPQYSPPPQGLYGHAPNGQFPPPPPAQGYGAPAPNQQFPPPAAAQGYGTLAPNQQFSPPPPQGYGAPAPNQQYAPPAQDYGAHAPNQQFPPPAQGYGAYAPNQQFPPASPPPSDQGYGQAPPPKGDELV